MLKIIFAALSIALVALVIFRIPAQAELQKTHDAITRINTQQAGEVRSDVADAIEKEYSDPRVRSAALQYARAEQVFLADVFNAETWRAAAQQEDRAYQCLGGASPMADRAQALALLQRRAEYIRTLVFNTPERIRAYAESEKFTADFGLSTTTVCDM